MNPLHTCQTVPSAGPGPDLIIHSADSFRPRLPDGTEGALLNAWSFKLAGTYGSLMLCQYYTHHHPRPWCLSHHPTGQSLQGINGGRLELESWGDGRELAEHLLRRVPQLTEHNPGLWGDEEAQALYLGTLVEWLGGRR